MPDIPYLFCRYAILLNDKVISPPDQFALLTDLRGRMCPHRKPEPTADDLDTYVMIPRRRQVLRETALSWYVSQKITVRTKRRYDASHDLIQSELEDTDEDRYTRFIALPRLSVVAINDRVGEHWLGARPGVARFQSVIKSVPGAKAVVDFAGTAADLTQAVKMWALDEFAFVVRPSNPTVSKYGEKLHDLMVADGIGRFRGVAFPSVDQSMHYSEDGLMSEAMGLAQGGYGQVGVKGTTPQGYRAAYRKPDFSGDKAKNEAEQQKPRQLKVYAESQETDDKEEEEVVNALLEFYGG